MTLTAADRIAPGRDDLSARLFGSEKANQAAMNWDACLGKSHPEDDPEDDDTPSSNSTSIAHMTSGSTVNLSSTQAQTQAQNRSSLTDSVFGNASSLDSTQPPIKTSSLTSSIFGCAPTNKQSIFDTSMPSQWESLVDTRRLANMHQQESESKQEESDDDDACEVEETENTRLSVSTSSSSSAPSEEEAAQAGGDPAEASVTFATTPTPNTAPFYKMAVASDTTSRISLSQPLPPHPTLKRPQTVAAAIHSAVMVEKALIERISVPIPPEFTSKKKASNSDSENDEQEIREGVLRFITRRADATMRYNGVLLLKKGEGGGSIFPRKLLTTMRQAATRIQNATIDRLDAAGKVWNAAAATHSRSTNNNNEGDLSFRYDEVASRCLGRLDIRYGMDQPPFSLPEVVSNPWLMPLIQSLLGDSAKLVYCGLILSFPGSAAQPWHQDGEALFPELLGATPSNTLQDIPPYALNVFVPLTPIDRALGPTEFWVASHNEKMFPAVQQGLASFRPDGTPHPSSSAATSIVGPTLNKGDVLIYDYRTCHRGTANIDTNGCVRPMLYLMYARPWFAEHVNFGSEQLFPVVEGTRIDEAAMERSRPSSFNDMDDEDQKIQKTNTARVNRNVGGKPASIIRPKSESSTRKRLLPMNRISTTTKSHKKNKTLPEHKQEQSLPSISDHQLSGQFDDGDSKDDDEVFF